MSKLFKGLISAGVAAALVTGLAVAQDKSDWPSDITIGTASQGGTYFVYGNGLANFIAENLKIKASGEVTGGPVQNVTLVQTGDHQLGLVTMGPAFEAWEGRSELAPGVEHKDVRALFPMYQTPFQVITLKSSGIKSVSDLEGKRVGVGPAGGTPGTYWPLFMEALGVKANVSYAGAADAASQLKDGLIDAFAFAAGLPIPAFSQLSVENEVVMFGFTPDEQTKVLEAYPAMAPFTIASGVYDGHDYEQPTVALWNFAVAHKDVPESMVYEIVKLVLENNDRMMQIHSAAKDTVIENWDKNSFMTYHPGAVKFLEEKGITVPDNLKD